MTDDKFDNVRYSEVTISSRREEMLLTLTGGNPGILITASSEGDGLGLDLDIVGGVTTDLIEPFLRKALTAVQQFNEQEILPK